MIKRMLFACASLLFGQVAYADLIVQHQSTGLTPTNWSSTLQFDPFDPALGTLTEVKIDFAATIQHDFFMHFTTPSTITLTTSQNSVTLDGYLFLATQDHTVSHTQDSGDFTPPSIVDHVSDSLVVPDPSSFINTLPVMAASFSTFTSDSGNGSGTIHTLAEADITLTYDYRPTAVPEPSTWILSVCAIFGFALDKLRRVCYD